MIAAALAVAAAGLGTATILRIRPRTGAGLLGWLFFLGVLSLALWTHLLLLLRIPVGLPGVLAGAVLLGAVGSAGARRIFAEAEWERPSLASIPVLASALFAVAGALAWPGLGFDGEVFYSLRAKSVLHYGTFWNPDFTDPARIHLGSRRPLLLPCVYADFALLAGTADHRLLRLWFALSHVAALGLIHDRFRPHPLWLAVLAWTPALWHDAGGVFTGYADATLAILFLLGLDAARAREPRLASFALGAAVLLKQDAWPFLIAAGIATVVARQVRGLAGLAVPAALVVLWLAIASRMPERADLGPPGQVSVANILACVPHWPEVLARIGSEMVKPKHWGAFWIVTFGALLLRAPRLTRDDAGWLLAVLLQLVAYIAVLATFAGSSGIVHATRVQGMRLVLHLAPLAWLWIARAWRSP